MKIPELEFDDDSDNSDVMNELYHFEKLDVNDVKIEWYNPNKVMNSDGWNEMAKIEEELESDPEI